MAPRTAALLAFAALPLLAGAEPQPRPPATVPPLLEKVRIEKSVAGLPIRFHADFEEGRADAFEPTDAKAWTIAKQGGNGIYALTVRKSDYQPPKHPVDPAIDMRADPPKVVDDMDAATFFRSFAEVLKDNPPNQVDYPMIHRLERVGFEVGESFDLASAPDNVRQAFERGYADGTQAIAVGLARSNVKAVEGGGDTAEALGKVAFDAG